MKYQLADRNNGNFGPLYDTWDQAEAALLAHFEEVLPTEIEVLDLEHQREAELYFKEYIRKSHLELVVEASNRFYGFVFIEWVEA